MSGWGLDLPNPTMYFNPFGGGPIYLNNNSSNTPKDQSLGMLDWAKLGLEGLQSLGGLYMGMKQYGMMKKTFNESREQWNKNYAAQRQTINTQLEDRQRARVASNPGAYESVGSYMDKNRIK